MMKHSTSAKPLARTAAGFLGGALAGGTVWILAFMWSGVLGDATMPLALGYLATSTLAGIVLAFVPKLTGSWRAFSFGVAAANIAVAVTVYEALANMKIDL
jgi:hypothetical protein